jgi:hypothetical protein
MQREFSFGHLQNPARLGDPMHVHSYGLEPGGKDFRLALRGRFSTDTAGIARCLGLQASANVEIATIIKLLESKISDHTLLTL